MKTGATDITVILDRSGSMSGMVEDMTKGFDQFIREQRKIPGECRVSLVQFDTVSIDSVYTALPLKEVPPLALLPRGGTPLWDAVGRTVQQTGERLAAMPEADRPERVLCIVITDGQENSSREWSAEKVREVVKHQQEVYKWTFLFLGANIDSFAEGGRMGVAQAYSSNYSPDAAFNMVQVMSHKVADYRLAATPTAAAAGAAWTEEDRQKMAGKKIKK